jgi:hypothetical protein
VAQPEVDVAEVVVVKVITVVEATAVPEPGANPTTFKFTATTPALL